MCWLISPSTPSGRSLCTERLNCVNEDFDATETTSSRLFDWLFLVAIFQSRASCWEKSNISLSPVLSTVTMQKSIRLRFFRLSSVVSNRSLVLGSITLAKSLMYPFREDNCDWALELTAISKMALQA